MKLKPLTLAVLAASGLSACSGGDASSGSTLSSTRSLSAGKFLACVDSNKNWQCDDGDVTTTVASTGNTMLEPDEDEYTLLEQRDISNARTLLLLSDIGSAGVTGRSTLRAVLQARGYGPDERQTIAESLDDKALVEGFAGVQSDAPIALAALHQYAQAVAEQGTATPVLSTFEPDSSAIETLATWDSDESALSRRQLSANGSLVLNNSETNRLYFFDASVSEPASEEFDLIPLDITSIAQTNPILRRSVALLHDVFNVVIDTVSAATAFTGTPATGSAVELEPGQGITAAHIVNQGREAIVQLNMLDGRYVGSDCQSATEGNEGLFRVSLEDANSYRLLADAPACVHSGFNLVATDAVGRQLAAWDSETHQLWLLDGTTMKQRSVLQLNIDAATPVQALVLTPGGRYLAVVRYGGVILIDVAAAKVLHQVSGDWGNVHGAGFAAGARQLLIADNQYIHALTFSDDLLVLNRSTTAITGGESITNLSISADGESYIAMTDAAMYWRSSNGADLKSINLAIGLDVQQAVLADNRVIIVARGNQDQQFRLMRITLNMPSVDLTAGVQ